jgi:tetratricopeptide (TPR) repeat protein
MNLSVTPKDIVMMEDHDRAYHAWKERGVAAGTLVHVDAHIDFGWIPEADFDEISPDGQGLRAPLLNPFIRTRKKMVDIGNYICPAIKDGMVKKFYWIVPDESWRDRRGFGHIVNYMKGLRKIKRYAGGALEVRSDHIRCGILGREVIVCSLEGLERIDEPVLLDIDVDFMLTPRIWDDLSPGRVPWISSEELFERLGAKINNVDVLTIAYSVEGGFTPLRFKYLGDELKSLFMNNASEEARKGMRCKIDALLHEKAKRTKEAILAYEEALKIDSRDASACFNLSILHAGYPAEDIERASYYYREAVRRDKTYATAFNNYGILYRQRKKWARAKAEYIKFLKIDKREPSALNGLGHIALAKRRYAEAGGFFDHCLSINNTHLDARSGKGIACFRRGELAEAEALFSGLTRDIPDSPEIYWWLGRIAERKRDMPLAIDHYKRAVMLGGDGPLAHIRLLRLYMAKGLYFMAREELGRLVKMARISF